MIINDSTKSNGVKASGLGDEGDTGNTDLTLADVQAAANNYQAATGQYGDRVSAAQLAANQQLLITGHLPVPVTKPVIAGISNTTLAILAGLAAVLLMPRK